MKYPDSTDYFQFREGLLKDYAPANSQERLLVHEVASTWRRLEECRERERLFFSLQRAREGLSDKPGSEVLIWYEKPHKAYDQIIHAIKDGELAFDRAVRRTEMVQDHRLRRDRAAARPKVMAMSAIMESTPEMTANAASSTEPRTASIARRLSAFAAIIALILLIPALRAQNFDDIKIERVFGGYRFAEGPAWSPDKFMVFFDVPANRMLKWVPGNKPVVERENTGGAMAAAYDHLGRLWVCESRGRRVTRTDKKGNVDVVAENWQGKHFNAPNDIAVRRDGNAYFTDPAFGNQADTRELDFYGVYRITPKGELELVAKPKGRPNGIALSATGRLLYVANSDEHNIRVYDLDKSGAATNERIFVSGIRGIPDGLRLDDKGNVYVAAAKVEIYSPEAKLLYAVELSEKPSNLVFGDPDQGTLYITARTSIYRTRTGTKAAVQNP